MSASPHKVPIASAIKNRKISSYAIDFANGTIAIPTKPHRDIIAIETVAYIQAEINFY